MIFSFTQVMTLSILPILAVGGDGVVSVASHLGRQLKDMVTAFLAQGQGSPDFLRLLPLMRAITTNPVPVKRALEFVGLKRPCANP